ncbi:hypothetical protein D039_3959A, partial [Vibrio parahaemolyticus EKP-028]
MSKFFAEFKAPAKPHCQTIA